MFRTFELQTHISSCSPNNSTWKSKEISNSPQTELLKFLPNSCSMQSSPFLLTVASSFQWLKTKALEPYLPLLLLSHPVPDLLRTLLALFSKCNTEYLYFSPLLLPPAWSRPSSCLTWIMQWSFLLLPWPFTISFHQKKRSQRIFLTGELNHVTPLVKID